MLHLLLHAASGSWLYMVEIFFSIIMRQATRCGSLPSVIDPIVTIENFIDGCNGRCQPFTNELRC